MTSHRQPARTPAGTARGGQFAVSGGVRSSVDLCDDAATPIDLETPCSQCGALTKRRSGRCRRCDPTRAERRSRRSPAASADRLAAEIERGVAQLVSGEDWQRYLDVQSKFHNYSFSNTMLIMMQRPDATAVAGYRKWQEMGRQVRAGERGIRILAPITRTEIDEETGAERSVMHGFRGVSVFDIDQTEGDQLPGLPISTLDGDVPDGMFDDLDRHATSLGATVAYADPSTDAALRAGANGYGERTPEGPRIVVRADLTPAQRAKTYAHEIGHITMGHLDGEHPNSRGHLLRADKELEAESFAYMVTQSWGVDSGDYTFGYTANWSGGDPARVRSAAENVLKAVRPYLHTADQGGAP